MPGVPEVQDNPADALCLGRIAGRVLVYDFGLAMSDFSAAETGEDPAFVFTTLIARNMLTGRN